MMKALPLIPGVLLLALLMGSEASVDLHRSTGLVVKVNPDKGTVLLSVNGHHLELIVGSGTVLLDEQGQTLNALKALEVGDYVREECIVQKDGLHIAARISVLTSVWRMLEIPGD